MRLQQRHVLVVVAALVLAVAMTSGCGSAGDEGPTAQQSALEPSQAPIDTYTDTGPSTGALASSGEVSRKALSPAERALVTRLRLVTVALAADGRYITVQFRVSPKLARQWQPGMLGVIDEASKREYADIPRVPIIGILFARPLTEGQIGYVMVNNVPPLKKGAKVTVILGGFEKKHVTIN